MKTLEQLAREAGMVDQLNQGAASCVYSHGCNGVTQEDLARFRAAVLEEAAGWQPIETAPTDGTAFLAHKPGIGLFAALILDSDHPDCEYDGGVHCGWDHKYVDGVTHWMPLPPPPAAIREAAKQCT